MQAYCIVRMSFGADHHQPPAPPPPHTHSESWNVCLFKRYVTVYPAVNLLFNHLGCPCIQLSKELSQSVKWVKKTRPLCLVTWTKISVAGGLCVCARTQPHISYVWLGPNSRAVWCQMCLLRKRLGTVFTGFIGCGASAFLRLSVGLGIYIIWTVCDVVKTCQCIIF